MKKYAQIQDIVAHLTDDKTFRTFFTIYLMAESDTERQQLNERFWRDVAALPEIEKKIIQAELTRCFLKLPTLAADLVERAAAVSTH